MRDMFLGIDPGKSGGAAAIDEDGSVLQTLSFGTATERDIDHWFADIFFMNYRKYAAALEKVGAMPGQGVTSMFTFGRSYGFLRGILVSKKIPFEDVTPLVWQRALGLIVKGSGKTKAEKKRANKQRAESLFPDIKITLATADALLLAEYLRRTQVAA